ncbi:MAG: tRNA lysidine(34) synthetase TilS [Candidatus Dormibacteria bacterium]
MQGSKRRRDNLVEAVLHACRRDPVLGGRGATRVVVALSGGPDSSAMLHALARAASSLNLNLTAVHVDHGLRPASAGDAAASTAFAAELGISVEVHRVRPRGGGEDAARRARHAGLEQVAARLGAATIALGHTADDQAETVLLHLLRGTGLGGLAAMAPREGLRFRPLLEVWRDQVETYCARNQLRPVHDETNDDLGFARNRVRHELIPLLEAGYNPRVREALVRLANAARQEHEVVVAAARRWLRTNPAPHPRQAFVRLGAGVRAEVLRTAWASATAAGRPAGDSARLGQALDLLASERTGMIHLGAGFELVVHATSFEIRPRDLLTGA